MSKRLEFLHALNIAVPTVSLSKALELANFVIEPGTINLGTHEGKVAFAKVDPEIQGFIKDERKIQAIKALRTAVQAQGHVGGLLECKNAIDEVAPRRYFLPTPPPPSYSSPGYNDYDEPPF